MTSTLFIKTAIDISHAERLVVDLPKPNSRALDYGVYDLNKRTQTFSHIRNTLFPETS